MPFRDKVVMITGASGNIGRTAALYFCKAGAHTVLLDISMPALQPLVDEITAIVGPSCLPIACDVTDAAQVANAVELAVQRFQRIDHLFNNAGIQGAMCVLEDYPVDDFRQVLEVNVIGVFNVMQQVAKQMKLTGGGTIVNTASLAGTRGTPTMVAYVASKAAVIGMTKTAAKDLAPHNIRVNAISPALIGPSAMWDRQNELHAQSGSPYFDADPAVVAERKIASVPMRRLGTLDEVIQGVAWLLGPAS
eukprot:EG_transcript_25466